MIKILRPNPSELLIVSPDYIHRMEAWLFTAIGFILTAVVLATPGAGISFAIVPVLILLAGIALFFFGGKPDTLKFDLESNTVEIVIMKSTLGKPKPKMYPLSELVSTELKRSSSSGMVNLSFRASYGIVLNMKDGSRIDGTPYINRKKEMESIYREIRNFITK